MENVINVVIDLSHHNGDVDLAAAKADGIVGVVHKATQGTTFADPKYGTNKKKAADAGLLWGAYHFGTGATDGVSQAKRFLEIVQPNPQTLVVLDLEENKGSSMTLAEARQFVTHIQSSIQRWPGLYGGSYLKALLAGGSDPVLANCWLWWAQYGPGPVIPPNWKTWTMWQYTDGQHGLEPHQVKGVGPCDRDKFQGDMNALFVLWGHGAGAAGSDH
jgi:lysozyme